jgi:predicted nuclease of restriction endonuclease-like (RecB) superfamily
MSEDLSLTTDYREFIKALKQKVQCAQIQAVQTVNSQLVSLYWDLGRMIAEKQENAGWGDAVIDQIAHDLNRDLKGAKGLSRTNLYRMKRFYVFYSGHNEFVAQAVRQIPWEHNILIFQKISDPEIAFWYAHKALENSWSRNVLALQIDNQLYERQAGQLGADNFSDKLPAPDSDLARESIKDPYIFDFLDLTDRAHEREVEDALMDHLTRFMLELGKGFAFVGRQYLLNAGTQEFYIDLLFYHLKLHCYVVIDLKTGKFKPEYAGKLNFYLTAVDEQVKTAQDNPSIGLILCRDRDNLVAEYALRDLNKPIAELLTQRHFRCDHLAVNMPR